MAGDGVTTSAPVINGSLLSFYLSNHSNTPVNINLSNIVAPLSPESSLFHLFTYDSNSFQISSSSIPVWTALCTLPCRTCNGAACLTCYSDVRISPSNLLDAVRGRCLASCMPTQLQIGSTCVTCNASCLECHTRLDNCTSCSAGTYLLESNCLAGCPEGYYRLPASRSC